MIVIWTKDNCVYCKKAKEKFTEYNKKFEERNINNDWTKEQLLQAAPAAKTVPQIFIDNQLIGGYTDLIESGILDRL